MSKNEPNDIDDLNIEIEPEDNIQHTDLEETERIMARKIFWHRILIRTILVLIILAALGVVIVWKVFTVEEVRVTGNQLHSEKSIQKTILSDKHSWNSLYVYFSYKLFDHSDEFPYADSVKVTLTNPHIVKVDVNEKDMIGYFYDSKENQFVGFGEDGEVLLLTKKEPEDYTRVTGLEPEVIKLYHNMKLSDDNILTFIKSVLTVLDNYDIPPEVIYVQKNGGLLLSYGDIQVNLGDSYYLNEKIVRMQQLLQKVEGQTGTLHLETWTESTTDVYFRLDELTTIPK